MIERKRLLFLLLGMSAVGIGALLAFRSGCIMQGWHRGGTGDPMAWVTHQGSVFELVEDIKVQTKADEWVVPAVPFLQLRSTVLDRAVGMLQNKEIILLSAEDVEELAEKPEDAPELKFAYLVRCLQHPPEYEPYGGRPFGPIFGKGSLRIAVEVWWRRETARLQKRPIIVFVDSEIEEFGVYLVVRY